MYIQQDVNNISTYEGAIVFFHDVILDLFFH